MKNPKNQIKNQQILPARRPADSKVTMTEIVLPQHTNALGGIFGGVVMSWIDIAAAITATRHSGRVCVTASIDELHFLKPIKTGFIVNIEAVITAVHHSSCEIKVEVSAENPLTRDCFHTARAFLTFVAIDDTGRPTEMAPLKITKDEEKKLQKDAGIRREHRQTLKAKLRSEISD